MRDRTLVSSTGLNAPWTGRLSGQSACAFLAACVVGVACVGCAPKPNAANIELRKRNNDLSAQVAQLEAQVASQRDAIQRLEASAASGATTVPTLPQDRVDQLFTAARLSIGRLSGWADLGEGRQGLKLYVVPTDASGDEIKAAGSFVVEAFDLAADAPRLARWEFSVDEARALWTGSGLLYEYVLPCPMDAKPTSAELTVKITFVDALTQRRIAQQVQIKLAGGEMR
jgi:outer membrane murein-binding lipoprotein Lpp